LLVVLAHRVSLLPLVSSLSLSLFFTVPATPEFYPLSLHDALPIWPPVGRHGVVSLYRSWPRRAGRRTSDRRGRTGHHAGRHVRGSPSGPGLPRVWSAGP